MRDRRTVDELSLTELEQILLTRRREERLRRLRERGIERDLPEPIAPASDAKMGRLPRLGGRRKREVSQGMPPSWRARLLTMVEVVALLGFVAAGWLWYQETQQTDLAAPVVAPLQEEVAGESEEALAILPGNPDPPTEEGAVPALYRDWVQPSNSAASVPLGDLSEKRPVRIAIPSLNVDAPVVQGTDWEALKRGAGHVIGTANPGERGNMVISAHNDIFGELFRHLEQLEPGDEFTVWDAENREYQYIVRTKRIVEPTEVSVLNPSPEPLATLITCYPYLIDSHRLVVQAELQ